jgi:hypothetical protein
MDFSLDSDSSIASIDDVVDWARYNGLEPIKPLSPPAKLRGPYLVLCFVGGNPTSICVDDLSLKSSTSLNPFVSLLSPETTAL